MNYTKVSDTKAEIVTTITNVQEVTSDQLLYDKDSLQRTIENNITDTAELNADIEAQIAVLDEHIQELKDLGLMTQAEYNKQHPVEPITPPIIQEDIINE